MVTGSNWIGPRSGPFAIGTCTGGAADSAAVLSHGTVLPLPQSQNTIVPAEVSGRLCVLPHFLQVNQIIIFCCRKFCGIRRSCVRSGCAGRRRPSPKPVAEPDRRPCIEGGIGDCADPPLLLACCCP